MCVSGFLSENDDPFKEWGKFLEMYPFTEILSLNWQSFSLFQSATSMISAMRGVSFRSLTSMFINSLHDVMPGTQKDNPTGIFGNNFSEERINRQKVDFSTGTAVSHNPFEGD